jgi:hypothetical protein
MESFPEGWQYGNYPETLVLYRTRVFDETVELSMVLFARSIKPFEQSRPAADASREANRTVVA